MFLKYFKITLTCLAAVFVANTSAQTKLAAKIINSVAMHQRKVELKRPGFTNIYTLNQEQLAIFFDDLIVSSFSGEKRYAFMAELLTDLGYHNNVAQIFRVSESKQYYKAGTMVLAEGQIREQLRIAFLEKEMLEIIKNANEDDLVSQINYAKAEVLNRCRVHATTLRLHQTEKSKLVAIFDALIKKHSDFDFPMTLLSDYEPGVGRITDETQTFIRSLLKNL